MPFVTFDPQEYGCYEGLEIPEGVVIPTTDLAAWQRYPDEAWVYNRLELARSFGHRCGPMDLIPSDWPVFVKPVYNFRGGGCSARAVSSQDEFRRLLSPNGLFWTELFTGHHHSFDLVLEKGRVVFVHTFLGYPMGDGMFDQWVTVQARAETRKTVVGWAEDMLADYTGAVNVETIGGRIIEAHLRMGDIDRCGSLRWMQALVDLYAGKPWVHCPVAPYTVVCLFGKYNLGYSFDEEFLSELRTAALTADEEHDDVMPAGGHRILVFSMESHQDAMAWRRRAIEAADFRPLNSVAGPLPTA